MLKNLLQMHLKQLQKKRPKKQRKQLVISLEIKSLLKLQEPQNVHQMKKKYLENDLYLQN